ncbi:MAG: NTP transferase domain-containing protein [Candidatus Hydrothermarchaeales archaeon]
MKRLDALVMAGGEGKRLGLDEKPLVELDGKPLISYVLDALSGSRHIDNVVVSTSKHTKKTQEFLKTYSIKTIETKGADYVEDMVYAVKKLNFGKTLVVSSDLPLITSKDIDTVIEEYFRQSCPAMKVVIPLNIFEKYKLKPSLVSNGLVPSGVNIVDGKNLDGKEFSLVTDKEEFAFNLNTLNDLESIERYKKLISK